MPDEETIETVGETEELDEVVDDTTEDNDEDTSDEPTDEEVQAELEALEQRKEHNKTNAQKRLETKKELPLSELVKKEMAAMREAIIADQATDILDEELASLSTNSKKQQLIRYHYENSIVKSGSSKGAIRSDLAKALAIADSSLLRKRANETTLARQANETTGTGAGMGASSSGSPKKSEDYMKYLNPTEIKFGKDRGWTPAHFKKAAEAIKARKKFNQ